MLSEVRKQYFNTRGELASNGIDTGLGDELSKTKNSLILVYDIAHPKQLGEVGRVRTNDTSGKWFKFEAGTVIERVYVDILTPVTSDEPTPAPGVPYAATIALSVGDTVGNILAPTSISNFNIPSTLIDGQLQNMLKLNAPSEVWVEILNIKFLTGKFFIVIDYSLSVSTTSGPPSSLYQGPTPVATDTYTESLLNALIFG